MDERGDTVEYVLIAILVGLCALFAVSRFGGSVRQKMGSASSHVEGIDRSGHAPSQPASTSSAGGGASGAGVQGGPSVLAPEKMGELPAEERGHAGIEVFGFTVDLKTALSLAVLVVVIGMIMVRRIAKGVRKAPKEA